MKEKFLSVFIPNYNHACYLPDCIASVLKEAPEDIEILIIDDASTDNSIEVIQAIASKDKRVRLLRNKVNKGANATIDFGLQQVSGKYYFGLAADDKLLPGFFTKTLHVLKKDPHLGLCCSDYAYFYDATPGQIHVNRLLKTNEPYLILPPEKTLEFFRKTHFWIPGHTTVARTEYARRYGGYQ